jgi:hypothetical protein
MAGRLDALDLGLELSRVAEAERGPPPPMPRTARRSPPARLAAARASAHRPALGRTARQERDASASGPAGRHRCQPGDGPPSPCGQAMIATLRHRLLRVPARLVRHARHLTLRLTPHPARTHPEDHLVSPRPASALLAESGQIEIMVPSNRVSEHDAFSRYVGCCSFNRSTAISSPSRSEWM